MPCSVDRPHSHADMDALTAILSQSKEFVAKSDDSDWSHMDTRDILTSLDAGLFAIAAGTKLDTDDLVLLFSPTGPLQETAMGNGWHDEYVELSLRFDNVISDWQ